MSGPVTVEREGALAWLWLDRPETRNAVSDADMVDALTEALLALDADPGVRVVILSGRGKAFSSGGNVRQIKAELTEGGRTPAQIIDWYEQGIQRIPRTFARLSVPVIAAVNGPAIGAGCDLACMCDLRIAARSARFAESFVKLGIVPGDGGAWLLPRVVGWAHAAELALTGDTIDAAQALAMGLVSQVVDDDALVDAARALALRVAANPAVAVRLTKRLLREAYGRDLEGVLQLSAALQAVAHADPGHREAIDAALAALEARRRQGT